MAVAGAGRSGGHGWCWSWWNGWFMAGAGASRWGSTWLVLKEGVVHMLGAGRRDGRSTGWYWKNRWTINWLCKNWLFIDRCWNMRGLFAGTGCKGGP